MKHQLRFLILALGLLLVAPTTLQAQTAAKSSAYTTQGWSLWNKDKKNDKKKHNDRGKDKHKDKKDKDDRWNKGKGKDKHKGKDKDWWDKDKDRDKDGECVGKDRDKDWWKKDKHKGWSLWGSKGKHKDKDRRDDDCPPDEPEEEEICTSDKEDCMLVELIEVVTGTDGTKTYRYKVTSLCKYGLSYIAFGLPEHATATAYSNSYPVNKVENPGGTGGWHNPSFRNIKFELGGDVKGGESVILEYTLPAGASYDDGIHIRTKSGWEIIDLHIDPSQCETDECVLDDGPPEITITETATGFEVTVTDDTGLADVSFNTTNLTQTDGTLNPGDETVTYTFEIIDETLGADIEVTATDECQKSSSDSDSKQSICELDEGPPVIDFTMNEEDGTYFLDILVTDDTKLEDVSLTINYAWIDPGNTDPVPDGLQLVDSTATDTLVSYRYELIRTDVSASVLVDAIDLCSQAACTDTEAPTLVESNGLEFITGVEDPTYPGYDLYIDGRVLVSDNVGIQTLDVILLDNERAIFLDDIDAPTTVTKVIEVTPESAPDELLGATEIPFVVQLVNPRESGYFGVLAADECNALVYDPHTPANPRSPEQLAKTYPAAQAPAALEAAQAEVPEEFALNQNYPNPFNPQTTISFDLPEKAQVRLEVYDVMGKLITELVNGALDAGQHQVQFDANNLASGTYFYRLVTQDQMFVKQMILVK